MDIHCIRSIRIGSYWIKKERIIHMMLDLRGSTHISPAAAAPHAPPLRVSAAAAAPHAHSLWVPPAAAAPHANLSRAPAAAARISLPASAPLVACKATGLDAARRPSKIRMRQGTWPRSGSSGKAPGDPPRPSVSMVLPIQILVLASPQICGHLSKILDTFV